MEKTVFLKGGEKLDHEIGLSAPVFLSSLTDTIAARHQLTDESCGGP